MPIIHNYCITSNNYAFLNNLNLSIITAQEYIEQAIKINITDLTIISARKKRLIKEKSVLNTVLKTSLDIQTGIIDPSKILKEFENACNISLIDNMGFDYLESIDKHCDDLQKVFNVIPTGWKWLDDKLGGGLMADGRALYVFFGVTNVGKSIFLGNMATNLLNQDKTVVLISLEMPEQIYAKRISSQLSKIPFSDLKLQTDSLKNHLNQYKVKNKMVYNSFIYCYS